MEQVKAVRAVDEDKGSSEGQVRSRLRFFAAAMQAALCERDTEINALLAAALAGEHVLLLGPPGTAKSTLARLFCEGIHGADYFQWLLTKFSAPEELFGPLSLQGLKRDKYQRVATGKMPEAHVVFLDEIFKANSAILNAMLTALEERVWHDDGTTKQLPLLTAVGASNELPQDDSLGALYDRFLVRLWVAPIRAEASFRAILTRSLPAIPAHVGITLDDWHQARREVAEVELSEEVVARMWELRRKLEHEGTVASDRRWFKCAKLVRAAAWLEGDTVATTDHMPVLAEALWNVPDERIKVTRAVAEFANPQVMQAQELYDAIAAHMDALPAEDAPGYVQQVVTANREIKVCAAKLQELEDKATGSSKKKVERMRMDLDKRAKAVREAARKALGV